jgi:2-phosphoglycerate kinase
MDWTVLLIGGASGIGKSYIAKELARDYQVKIIEVDDICQAVKAMTTRADLPAIHYWSTGVNWKDIGVVRPGKVVVSSGWKSHHGKV